MAKIKSFDKATSRLVGNRIVEALKNLGNELGVEIKPAGGRYTDSNFTFKLQIAVVDTNGTAITKEREALQFLAPQYGITDKQLAKPFQFPHDRHTYKLVGVNVRAYKRPMIVERDDGKEFIYPEDDVLRAMGART